MKVNSLNGEIAFVKSVVISEKQGQYGTEQLTDEDIYLMNSDGTSVTKLVDNLPNTDKFSFIDSLTWSPKGSYLSWIKNGERDSFEYIRSQSLLKSDPSGANVNSILTSDTKGSFAGFSISPDEDKVALIESNSMEKGSRIKVFNLNTKSLIETIEESTGKAYWSDNNTIIGQNDADKIISVNISTKNNPKEFSIGTDSTMVGFSSITKKIIFEKSLQNDAIEFWASDLDGTHQVLLNTQKESSAYFVGLRQSEISPDGKVLALVGNNAEAVSFFLLNLESGKMVNAEIYGMNFSWNPDSKQIVSLNGLGGPYPSSVVVAGLEGKVIKELLANDPTRKTSYSSPAWFPK